MPRSFSLLLLAFLWSGPLMAADPVTVRVVDGSEPTLCAEKDNVYLKLYGPAVRSFTVEAVHPNYMGMLMHDRSAPDFTNCDFDEGPKGYEFIPKRVTIYEDIEWQLVAYTFKNFWRPNLVPFTVGDKTHDGFHLVQLWVRSNQRAEEVLVLYPGDGYWRARPLPPLHLGWSAYGSSFLVGPVEVEGRPIVDIAAIRFDPEKKRFDFDLVRGGKGSLEVKELDRDKLALDVALIPDPAGWGDRPFAALRSMFVTETNNDAARIAWRHPGNERWGEAHIMGFGEVKDAIELWTGRWSASRHNTSAPDTVFRAFKGAE